MPRQKGWPHRGGNQKGKEEHRVVNENVSIVDSASVEREGEVAQDQGRSQGSMDLSVTFKSLDEKLRGIQANLDNLREHR